MKAKVLGLMTMLMGLLCTVPLFGADQAAAASGGGTNWVAISAGFSMAIASGLCGLGQGRAAAGACEGVARNPGARQGIFLFLILALIFIESLALYTLAIIFIKVK
jgi:F-type H+-transporting ATPase subunit c